MLVLEIYYDVDIILKASIIVKILSGLDLDENAFLLNEIFIFSKKKKKKKKASLKMDIHLLFANYHHYFESHY